MEIHCITHNILIHIEYLNKLLSRGREDEVTTVTFVWVYWSKTAFFHSAWNLNIAIKGKPVPQQQVLVFHRTFCKCTPAKIR